MDIEAVIMDVANDVIVFLFCLPIHQHTGIWMKYLWNCQDEVTMCLFLQVLVQCL